MEEFRRAGVEVVFLNRAIGETAEDKLLLQIEGVISEYERAQIVGASCGRWAAACRRVSGLVSALTAAPYGYRYVRRDQGDGVARFEVVEDEATCRAPDLRMGLVLDRLSLRAACRRLQQMGCRTRRGLAHWSVATIYGMLEKSGIYWTCSAWPHTRFLLADLQLRSNRRNARPRTERDATCPRRGAKTGLRLRFRPWSILRCSKPHRCSSLRTASASANRDRVHAGCCRD